MSKTLEQAVARAIFDDKLLRQTLGRIKETIREIEDAARINPEDLYKPIRPRHALIIRPPAGRMTELEQAVAAVLDPPAWDSHYSVPHHKERQRQSLVKARAVLAVVRDALREPTPEMLDEIGLDGLADGSWTAMLAASPLGDGDGN